MTEPLAALALAFCTYKTHVWNDVESWHRIGICPERPSSIYPHHNMSSPVECFQLSSCAFEVSDVQSPSMMPLEPKQSRHSTRSAAAESIPSCNLSETSDEDALNTRLAIIEKRLAIIDSQIKPMELQREYARNYKHSHHDVLLTMTLFQGYCARKGEDSTHQDRQAKGRSVSQR